MFPENLVLDEVVSPKSFAELIDLVETSYQVNLEKTTLECIAVRPDGTVQTPAGDLRVTRNFLEGCSRMIQMPLTFAYKISPELFCENFAKLAKENTAPITVSRVGDVATGLIHDRKSRYRPASTAKVLRAVQGFSDLTLRRASVSFEGVDVELVKAGNVVEPVVGDVVEIGVAVTNSESGGRQLKASAYTYRLVCTNGAILSEQIDIDSARWANDPRLTPAASLLAFQKDMAMLADKLQSVASLYKSNVDRLVPDVELFNLWRRVAYVLPRNEADGVLGISEDDRRKLQQAIRVRDVREPAALTNHNVYNLHNRVTFAAHGRNFGSRRSLQEIGGAFLTRAVSWPSVTSPN